MFTLYCLLIVVVFFGYIEFVWHLAFEAFISGAFEAACTPASAGAAARGAAAAAPATSRILHCDC